MILLLRTDKPESEIYMFKDGKLIAEEVWHAHRRLAETIHEKIEHLAEQSAGTLEDISGIVFYEGPGSFTGLRIGAAVANALAEGLSVPVVQTSGANWREDGIKKLKSEKTGAAVLPVYGGDPHVTKPRK